MAVDHATDIRRTITGLILAAIVILALVLRGWVLLAIILLVAALGLWEFFSLFWGNKRIPSRICAIALGWGMLTLTWAHRTQDALVCLGAGFVLAAMSFLFRWNEVEEEGVPAFASSGIFMAGLAYIPLLLLPATYLSTTKLLFVLAAVAISDTSAYFVGTRFGHHKLWPRVSPNKSSEGAVGSLVAASSSAPSTEPAWAAPAGGPSPCWGSPSMPSPAGRPVRIRPQARGACEGLQQPAARARRHPGPCGQHPVRHAHVRRGGPVVLLLLALVPPAADGRIGCLCRA